MERPHATAWDSAGVNVAAFLVSNDFDALVEEKQSLIPKQELPLVAHVGVVTTARDYERDYDANEIAADRKYHSKRILVYGTISSINIDGFGKGYFTLESAGPMGVQAHLDDQAMEKAATQKRGDRVVLACHAGMRVIGIATLDDCFFLSQYLQHEHITPEEQVRSFFSGSTPLPFKTGITAITGYVMGTAPFIPETCKSAPNTVTCGESKWDTKGKTPQQLNDYISSALERLQTQIKRVSCSDPKTELPKGATANANTCLALR